MILPKAAYTLVWRRKDTHRQAAGEFIGTVLIIIIICYTYYAHTDILGPNDMIGPDRTSVGYYNSTVLKHSDLCRYGRMSPNQVHNTIGAFRTNQTDKVMCKAVPLRLTSCKNIYMRYIS